MLMIVFCYERKRINEKLFYKIELRVCEIVVEENAHMLGIVPQQ